MVDAGDDQLRSVAAWPVGMLYEGARPVGFTMPRLNSQAPLHELLGPKRRQMLFPDANWKFLIHTAENVARAFEVLHGRGVIVGDVNSSNLVVYRDSMTQFIDCDSFQVAANGTVFRCRVGVAEYQPPELHGKDLSRVDRMPQHDLFGLAVMIFQLLFVGKASVRGRPADQHPQHGRDRRQRRRAALLLRPERPAYGAQAAAGRAEPDRDHTRDLDAVRACVLGRRALAPVGRHVAHGAARSAAENRGLQEEPAASLLAGKALPVVRARTPGTLLFRRCDGRRLGQRHRRRADLAALHRFRHRTRLGGDRRREPATVRQCGTLALAGSTSRRRCVSGRPGARLRMGLERSRPPAGSRRWPCCTSRGSRWRSPSSPACWPWSAGPTRAR
ncbi:MAG: hypothetical protein ACLPSH_09860 [Vulcanimicrobiaceae bacterium]